MPSSMKPRLRMVLISNPHPPSGRACAAGSRCRRRPRSPSSCPRRAQSASKISPATISPRRPRGQASEADANSRSVSTTSRLRTDDPSRVAGSSHARRGLAGARRSCTLQPRHQFVEGEGLHDVVVGPGLEPAGAVLDLGQGRKHQDGQPRCPRRAARGPGRSRYPRRSSRRRSRPPQLFVAQSGQRGVDAVFADACRSRAAPARAPVPR